MFYDRHQALHSDSRIKRSESQLRLWPATRSRIRLWWAMYHLKCEVRRERKELRQLPEDLLRDIGITRYDAMRESAREADDLPVERVRSLVSCGSGVG